MKKYLFFSFIILSSLSHSCSRDYDLSKADKSISIGGEQFVFPLGNSTKMNPDSIMNFSSIKELRQDGSGNYFFNYSGSVSQSISYTSMVSDLSLPDKEVNKTMMGFALPVLTDSELDMLTFPVDLQFSDEEVFEFTYNLSDAKKEGLIRLDSAKFSPSHIAFAGKLNCVGVSTIPVGIEMGLEVILPSRIQTSDPRQVGDVIKVFSQLTSDGKTRNTPIDFDMINLTDPTNAFKFTENIRIRSTRIIVPSKSVYKTFMGKDMSFELKVSIEGTNGGVIAPEIIWCLMDRGAEPRKESIEITGIPDYMKDGVLDLVTPLLSIDLATNATFPVIVDADISSYSGTSAIGSTSASVITDYVSTPYQKLTTHYLLANEDLELPDYKFVKTDIRTLVKSIPDVINLTVTPHTYYQPSDPASQQVVFVNEVTNVDVDYDLTIPLVFGQNLKMELRDTVTKMPEKLGEILTKCDISLIGEASSTLPADFVLRMNFLDADGNSLDMHSTESVIRGTSQSGIPVSTSYSVDIKKSANAGKISDLELILQVKNGQSFSLTSDDYIQLSILASVPGGIEFEIE